MDIKMDRVRNKNIQQEMNIVDDILNLFTDGSLVRKNNLIGERKKVWSIYPRKKEAKDLDFGKITSERQKTGRPGPR